MGKNKVLILGVLMILLVFIGVGCAKNPGVFYRKVCKVSVPFQENLNDFYEDTYLSSTMNQYDSVEECVEKSLQTEEKVYRDCLKKEADKNCSKDLNDGDRVAKWERCLTEDDLQDCQEIVDKVRELTAEIITKNGCENTYGVNCAHYKVTDEMKGYISKNEIRNMNEEYEKCMNKIKDLCKSLPEEF